MTDFTASKINVLVYSESNKGRSRSLLAPAFFNRFMTKVKLVKPLRNTKLYRKNQKCWIYSITGAQAIMVRGRYKGKGRYIDSWLHFPKDFKYEDIKEIELSKEDAKKIGIFLF